MFHHQSVLSKGRSFTANSGTNAAVLPRGKSSTANSGTNAAVLLKVRSFTETQEPRLQFHLEWICVVASRYFAHPTLSLASERTLKDLKRSQGHQRGGEDSIFS